MHRLLLLSLLWIASLPAHAGDALPLRLDSPDGRATVELSLDAQGQPHYAVAWQDQHVLLPSPLGVQLDDDDRIERGLRILDEQRSAVDTQYDLVAGKTKHVRDRYRQLDVTFADARGRRLGVVVRAYDDGIALRYRLPLPAQGDLRLKEDLTGFLFPRDFACHALNLGRFGTSHEGEYDPIRARLIRPHHLIELPLVCATGIGTRTFAIAEADLDRYAGLYLTGRGDGRLGVEAKLSPRLDTPNIAVRVARNEVARDGHLTPWRVLMLGDTPGALVESNLISNLNPPTPIADTSWIRPGKAAWDWWSGGLAPDVADAGMNNATMRRYIDHAASLKLEYMLIDDGWYVGSFGNGRYNPQADITRAVPAIDLPALVDYAGKRGVGLWLWVHWRPLEVRMDEVLAQYQRLGIKGIKVDFMDRDDQQMVAFFHRLMRAAAAHELMVNMHGAYRPTGLNRTWPNYLTQEGVLGAENNKWSRRITPTHNVTLPFTRMLLGPMDYTPGGFRNVSVEAFEPAFTAPKVMGTRSHQLAMYVVYDSPLQIVADSPDAYVDKDGVDAAGADFIADVPASWDETRVLAGAIGEYIATARRRGKDWYVGAMSNEQARTLALPLAFLGKGSWTATIWSDGEAPTDVHKRVERVDPSAALQLDLSGGGGAVVKLSPGRR
jgi:alpha-glucosidase